MNNRYKLSDRRDVQWGDFVKVNYESGKSGLYLYCNDEKLRDLSGNGYHTFSLLRSNNVDYEIIKAENVMVQIDGERQ
jgi:hypothetical protein